MLLVAGLYETAVIFYEDDKTNKDELSANCLDMFLTILSGVRLIKLEDNLLPHLSPQPDFPGCSRLPLPL